MEIIQRKITLPRKTRGCHLITQAVCEALSELPKVQNGLLHVFLLHTSAGLSINENSDPTVRRDMETALSRIVPETWDYEHDVEGSDDMPAHVKTALVGCDVTIPIQGGRLQLGTWQGIYLHEFRTDPTPRSLFLTMTGIMDRVTRP